MMTTISRPPLSRSDTVTPLSLRDQPGSRGSHARRPRAVLRTALAAAILALGYLPPSVRLRLGALGGFLYGCCPSRDRQIAHLQIQRFLRPREPIAPLLRQVFSEVGRTTLSALNLAPLLATVDCSSSELIDRLKAERRPVLALTAHFGPWDLLGAWVVSRGLPLATVGRAARQPMLQTVLASVRARYGITTIWRDEDRGMRRIIGHLRGGGAIAALIDQDTDVSGVPIPFFGHPAHTPSGLIELARRCQAHIITAFISRNANGRYTIDLRSIDDGATPTEVLMSYTSRLEEHIRAHPTQWVWFHKRWRTQPDGTRLSSREYAAWLKSSRDVSS